MENSEIEPITFMPHLNLANFDSSYDNLNMSLDIGFDLRDILNDPNFSNIFDKSEMIREWIDGLYGPRRTMTIALIVIYSIAFFLGLFGNLFVICVVAYYRHMRTPINIFLVNLAVGDLLVVFVCIPITLSNYIYRDYVFGPVICKLVPFIQGTSVAVSSLSLLVISTNRYFAIHRPMRAKMTFSKQKVHLMILAVWSISCIVFVPLVVVNYVTILNIIPELLQMRLCTENWKNLAEKHWYNVVIFVMLFVIPLVAMICTYSRIGFTLWHGPANFIGVSASVFQAERILRQRRRSVRMLIVVASLFVICWLPYYVVNIWLDFNIGSGYTKSIMDNVFPLVQILGFCNSTVNPICYCFMSTGFRRALLKCCLRRRLISGTPNAFLTIRFRSTDESPLNSVETDISKRDRI